MNPLAAAISIFVEEVAETHVVTAADAYRTVNEYTPAAASAVRNALPASQHEHLAAINNAWASVPDVAGASIALSLETAMVAKLASDRTSVEVVVTGPDSPAAPVRLTSEVVKQLVADARQRLLFVSFAAYEVSGIIAALDAAVARGVQVDLILESPEKLEGGGGAHAYAKYRVFHWPVDQRHPPEAKLHAKAVIVDGRDVLLTSANMTNAAYDKNIELGVLCRSGMVAQRVQKHFDALIAGGVLVEA